jgi:hypothetical protein
MYITRYYDFLHALGIKRDHSNEDDYFSKNI